MYERFHTYTKTKPRMRKTIGWIFVIFGFIALVTPLTPGGLLFFVGLELLGLRFIGTEKLKRFFMKEKSIPVLDTITVDTSPHTIQS